MKSIILAGAIGALVTSTLPTVAQDAPKEPMDKVSHSIGYNVGRSLGGDLKSEGVEANLEVLVGAFKDALTDGKSKMTEEEMTATMQTFMADLQKKNQEKRAKLAEANKAAGDKFLSENKTREGWKTTESGLQYKVVTEGKGDKPKETDTVKVHYRGTLTDGKEFDSSIARGEPATFPVSGVIPGWTEALKLMPVGSKWQLAIPSQLAYGESGPEEIGPNSVLLFDVELLGIEKTESAPNPGQ